MITVNFKCIRDNDITKERVLAGFSPCFVEWSDSTIVGNKVGKLTASVIGGGTHTFTNLVPNSDGKFYFDLSMIVKPYLLMCKPWRAKDYSSDYATNNDENGLLTFADVIDINFKFGINETESSQEYLSFTRSAMQLNQTNRASLVDFVSSNISTDESPTQLRLLLHSNNVRRWTGYPLDVPFMVSKTVTSGTISTIGIGLYHLDSLITSSGLNDNNDKNAMIATYYIDEIILDIAPLELRVKTSMNGGAEINTVFKFNQFMSHNECGYYIRWRNNFGGWSYWLFEANASHTEQVGDRSNMLEVFTTDPYLESTKRILERSKIDQTILATSTSLDWEVAHLSDLNTSTEVYLYKLSKGALPQGKPEEWEQVKVVNLTYDPTTDRTPVKAYRLTIEKIDTITQSC